jgi:hypothetical protein
MWYKVGLSILLLADNSFKDDRTQIAEGFNGTWAL